MWTVFFSCPCTLCGQRGTRRSPNKTLHHGTSHSCQWSSSKLNSFGAVRTSRLTTARQSGAASKTDERTFQKSEAHSTCGPLHAIDGLVTVLVIGSQISNFDTIKPHDHFVVAAQGNNWPVYLKVVWVEFSLSINYIGLLGQNLLEWIFREPFAKNLGERIFLREQTDWYAAQKKVYFIRRQLLSTRYSLTISSFRKFVPAFGSFRCGSGNDYPMDSL